MDDKKMTIMNQIFSYVLLPCVVLYIFIVDLNIMAKHKWIIGIGVIAFIVNVIVNAVYRNKKNPDYHFEVGPTYTKVMTGFVVLELILSSGLFS